MGRIKNLLVCVLAGFLFACDAPKKIQEPDAGSPAVTSASKDTEEPDSAETTGSDTIAETEKKTDNRTGNYNIGSHC